MPRLKGSRVRVFIGPIEIAGYYGSLAAGLRSLGTPATFVDLAGHPFSYADDGQPNGLVRLVRAIAGRRSQSNGALRLVLTAVEAYARGLLLVWAIYRFDVFIFGFGTTILRLRELPLLRLLGKRIIFVFNGTDSRPPYMDGSDANRPGGLSSIECVRLARARKREIMRIERFADLVVCHPLSAHFFGRPVVSFLAVGIPQWPPSAELVSRLPGSAVRVLHAPSNPGAKGSARIREAIDAVRAMGVPIDYVELVHRPHAVVLSELARCDFVVDQAYSDQPMAGFATEAAWFGKPAVVGGYGWADLAGIVSRDDMPPSETCRPDELASRIHRLASDAAYRTDLGLRARRFVEDNWAAGTVASRFATLIDGDVPSGAWFEPTSLRYAYGCGLSEEAVRVAVRGVVDMGSVAALQLADKPELEQAVIALLETQMLEGHPGTSRIEPGAGHVAADDQDL